MKQKFYICKHCGNIATLIRDAGVPIMCCGEKMHEIKPGTTEASVVPGMISCIFSPQHIIGTPASRISVAILPQCLQI